jgi:hypothetical protein
MAIQNADVITGREFQLAATRVCETFNLLVVADGEAIPFSTRFIIDEYTATRPGVFREERRAHEREASASMQPKN